MDYETFTLKIKDKAATACFFEADWKGPAHGVKIGDNQERGLKVLGKNTHEYKHPNGLEDYGWDLKSPKAVFWVFFDGDYKIKKIDVEQN